ncbi:MAG: molybdopterin-guanine dinucleotide biosynthesis protein B [Armatimonadota bacterium]|nr:molybdopterin-guanine dinucleotide biosynthesis protein B [Armatimonadota bacterium]MDR7569169.1 molybdopterin-guanine dinucleotide biosynthesis protein B [Armatimonadota bacterium]MDR7613385.1 molybdopterin-guanine dinucleotide biosynthesis protein B [Armatimonadota bacterium]
MAEEAVALDLELAFQQLLREAEPVGTERVPVAAAAGRVAAESYVCPRPVPSFRRAAMDGYVVWEADVRDASPNRPVRLRITGEVRMGEEPAEGPGRGEAWAIPTGGALPRRGDRVIPIEQVRREQDVLVFSGPMPRKPHVAEPGEEARPGAVLVQRGEVIRPAAVGALAACGFGEIEVYRRPRVVLLATGDELVDPPALPPPGRVVNSNAPTLAAELVALGCEVRLGGIVPDAPESLAEAFRAALEEGHHVVLTTGAVSVGATDRVPRTWLDLGARRILGRVDLKPGGPFFAGRVGECWGIGLSGNPAACLAAYHLLVRPFLLRLGGHARIVRPVVLARLRSGPTREADRTRALWGRVFGEPPEVETLEEGGTLVGMSRANGLVLLRPGTPRLRPGSRVPVLCLDRREEATELRIPPAQPAPLVVGVVGASGSGKTTVIEGLLRRLRSDGRAVAAIKHAAHGFDPDRPGSDSHRMACAGARAVLVAGPEERFLRLRADPGAPSVERLVEELADASGGLDLVLVEGFRHRDHPVVRVGAGKDPQDGAWLEIPAFSELPRSRQEAVLDDLAARIRTWLREGGP